MSEENGTQREPQTINVANAQLLPMPDGSGAVARFTLLGALNIEITFPARVVDDFFSQWIAIKQEMASIARLVNKVHHSKI